MFSQAIRYIACSLIGVATFFLALGMLLFQAAYVTGATSNYNVPVSWFSVLSSVIWPPSWRLFLLLLGVLFLAGFTLLIFFRAPRSVGVVVLFLQAGIAFYWGGALGWFFIFREFEAYHFNMDAEKLGEYWFVFEAVGIWTLAAATLAVLRVFARKQLAENSSR
jgi:hypothetical protein